MAIKKTVSGWVLVDADVGEKGKNENGSYKRGFSDKIAFKMSGNTLEVAIKNTEKAPMWVPLPGSCNGRVTPNITQGIEELHNALKNFGKTEKGTACEYEDYSIDKIADFTNWTKVKVELDQSTTLDNVISAIRDLGMDVSKSDQITLNKELNPQTREVG